MDKAVKQDFLEIFNNAYEMLSFFENGTRIINAQALTERIAEIAAKYITEQDLREH